MFNSFTDIYCLMPESETFPLVKGLINEFELKGFEIEKANYGEYSKPDVVKKFRPDVVGWNNDKKLFYLGDVLTKDILQNKETMDKLLEHSNLTMKVPQKEKNASILRSTKQQLIRDDSTDG